jgi:hypothetical protein
VCSAIQDALRSKGGAIVCDSSNPYRRVWEMLESPETAGARVQVVDA